ncbi:MAG: DUF2147 domain-containing protein [Lysobacteraceae bacterium]|nr:MAG: DUF2147 domain-containing protein [Xanthomonadaceae bacterium]
MRIKAMFAMLALPLLALSFAASAQNTPVGRWKTYDEETQKPRLIVEVYEAKGGTYAAKVLETLFKPDAICTECKGDKKGKPIEGMVIMWNQKPNGDGSFSGGTVLKLDKGKTYGSKARLLDGGKKLEVSGCLGPICKHQIWTREP